MAKMSAPNPKDVKALNDLLAEQNNNLSGINSKQKEAQILAQQRANIEKAIIEHQKEFLKDNKDSEAAIRELNKQLDAVTAEEKQINAELQKQIKYRKDSLDLTKHFVTQLKLGWKYLQDQDKIIKSTNLNLGMSGAKAAAMRDSFEKSAGYVTRLGGTLADIQGIMQGYADETGRARTLSAEMVKDITSIGKGTGLGIEQAAKLGAQFEIMGYDARSTMEYVQGVVDTSERMGVNTTKVLKNVNDNFKKLNTYTFQQGVKGFAQMAMYAEKFKIDIGQALNAADVARSLEGAIDLAANLQIMGGEFAKTDPFEMLFLSRNDPAKFTEKIADMTKGVVSFRKMADGSFEKYISPADRDRLAAVAKSMGMEASALTEIAQRQAEVQKMRQQMAGMGLSDEQKKLIEGAAIFDNKTGKFQVKLAGTMRDISTLTGKQAESFAKEKVSLEERAKQAMTFDETFKATIETLKAALLPILNGVNKILIPLSKVADAFSTLAGKGFWGIVGAAGILLTGAMAWKGAAILFNKGITNFEKGGFKNIFSGDKVKEKIGSSLEDNVTDSLGKVGGKTGKPSSGLAQMRAGKGKMMAGAGAGAAMAGAGAGIMLAAKGISQLADSMSKLTPEQAKNLKDIAVTMAITFPLSAIGIALAGSAASAGALGFLALGAAFVGIGFGIKLATEGIGKMAYGLAELNKSGGGAGKELLGVAGGIGAITLAMGTGGVAAMFAFNNSLSRMNKNSGGIKEIGIAFAQIQTVLSGTKDDMIAVENAIKSISGANIKGGGILADLANLIKQPLKVEFTKGKVEMVNDITLNIDGQKFMQQAYKVNTAVQMQQNVKNSKGDQT